MTDRHAPERRTRRALPDRGDQRRIGIGIPAGRQVMAARPLVAQCPVDQQEKGWSEAFGHKPRRRDADQGAASESEQFLGDQDGKRCSDRAADHAVFRAPCPPTVETRMETGPGGILNGSSRVGEVLDEFPVEVQEASGRNETFGSPFRIRAALSRFAAVKTGVSEGSCSRRGIRVSSATDRHPLLPAPGLLPVDLLPGLPDDRMVRGEQRQHTLYQFRTTQVVAPNAPSGRSRRISRSAGPSGAGRC